MLTTLDCSTTPPIGVNYIGKRNGEETYHDIKLCVKQIQICEGCLENVNHDFSCIRGNGNICNSWCTISSEQNVLCASCSQKGYDTIDPSLRPCRNSTMTTLKVGTLTLIYSICVLCQTVHVAKITHLDRLIQSSA